MGEDDKATEVQEYLLELMDVTREEADREIEALEKAAAEKQQAQEGGTSCTTPEVEEAAQGVRVDKTPGTQQEEEDDDDMPFKKAAKQSSSSSSSSAAASQMQQQIEMLDKHQEYLNSPEFRKKIDYDNLEEMDETDLGFAPMSGARKKEPMTVPATRKKMAPQKDDSHILESTEIPDEEEDDGPFAKPVPKKKTW